MLAMYGGSGLQPTHLQWTSASAESCGYCRATLVVNFVMPHFKELVEFLFDYCLANNVLL